MWGESTVFSINECEQKVTEAKDANREQQERKMRTEGKERERELGWC